MQYDEYAGKIQKVASVLKLFFKYMAIIIAVLALIVGIVTALLATKGMITKVGVCPEKITFGDSLQFEAKAFLSKVYFEYSDEKGEEWSTDEPKFPGTYKVRASAKTTFGGARHSDEMTYTIEPKKIDVSITDSEVYYGDDPSVGASGIGSASISCDSFSYKEILIGNTKVTPNLSAIKITSPDGEDLTRGYSINTVTSDIKITKRPITVTTGSDEKVYDGKELTSDKYEITLGSLVLGHTLSGSFDGSITDAGSADNTASFTVKDGEHDVTELYKISLSPGTLKVTQRPITLKTESASFLYNGGEYSVSGYELTDGTSLVEGERIRVISSVRARNAGAYDNVLEIDIINSAYDSVLYNYNVTYNIGTLEIKPREITVKTEGYTLTYDGEYHTLPDYDLLGQSIAPNDTFTPLSWHSHRNAGTYFNSFDFAVFSADGEDTTQNYVFTCEFGNAVIEKKELNISTASRNYMYDGIEHVNDDHTVTGLVPSDAFSPISFASILHVGKITNAITEYTITDPDGGNAKENYDIKEAFGTLEVVKRAITVTTPTESWIYDSSDHYSTVLIIGGNGLADTDSYVINDYTVVHHVSSKENKIDFSLKHQNGDDSYGDYDIQFTKGTLSVTKREVIVNTSSGSFRYDGKEKQIISYTVGGFGLAGYDTLSEDVDLWAGITFVGSIDNDFTFKVTSESGEDVTDNYDLTAKVLGTIEVFKRDITFTSISTAWIYDGEAHSDDGYYVGGYGLAENDVISATDLPAITNVGYTENQYSFIIKNASDTDVTDNYNITDIDYGILTVTERPLAITTKSDEKVYDGTPLANSETFEDTGKAGFYNLVSGHTYSAQAIGSITDVGTIENPFANENIVILDKDGNDVTYNYSISLFKGELTVHPITLHITTESMEWEYDGLTHSHVEYEISGDDLLDNVTYTVASYQSLKEPGSISNELDVRVIDASANDITSNYNVVYTYGVIKVNYRKLTVTTSGGSWVYDGKMHTIPDFNVSKKTPLIKNHTIEGNPIFTFSDVGEYENSFNYVIRDAESNDVTHCYDITSENGSVVITPLKISVTFEGHTWTYDGKDHSEESYTANTDKLIKDHTFTVDSFVTVRNVGKTENDAVIVITDSEGVSVTHNYDIEITRGTLEVKARIISITTESGSLKYNSEAQIYPYATVSQDGLADTDMLSTDAEYWSSLTHVGKIENRFKVKIVNKETGADETANYSVKKNTSGTFEITKRTISIETGSKYWEFDGKRHYCDEYTVGIDGLGVNDTISQTNLIYISDIGTVSNDWKYKIINVYDETDVSSNYDVASYTAGTLEVSYRKISIQSKDASFTYDGKEHGSKAYTITGGGLYKTHSIRIIEYRKETEIGVYINAIKLIIVDETFTDVTASYELTLSYGILRITENSGEVDPGEGNNQNGNLDESGNIQKPEIGNDDDGSGNKCYVITTTSDGRVYLKLMSFGDYNGSGWDKASDYGVLINSYLPASYLTSFALMSNSTPLNHITVTPYTSQLVIPYYATDFNATHDIQTSDVKYTGDTSVPYELSYFAWDYTQLKLPKEYTDYEVDYRNFVYNNYLTIDDETLAYMNAIIEENGFVATDMAIIEKVAAYIQNAADYNLDYDYSIDQASNVIIAFLEGGEGICQHYASAATMLFRALGIPARYTVGYAVNAEAGIETAVTAAEAHAWVEVYVKGLGWVMVEVTGGFTNDSPSEEEKETIIVSPSYQYKQYDGYPLYAENTIRPDEVLQRLVENGYTYSVTVTGMLSTIGEGRSKATSFTLYDPFGEDVTANYNVVFEDGVLAMNEVIIEIYLYELQKYYDGTSLSYTNTDYEILSMPYDVVMSDLNINISLTDVGFITADEINASISDYITFTAYKNGIDITENVLLVVTPIDPESEYLPIEINARNISITTSSIKRKYTDGAKIFNSGVTIISGSLSYGHKIKVVDYAILEEVGTIENYVDFMIVDAKGNDVTSHYNIKAYYGTLILYE